MNLSYNLEKIKFGVDASTFEKAVNLYESGKVIDFKEDLGEYSATVIGTHLYNVAVSDRYYDRGDCDCYLGQNNILCKHMVAVAIYAIMRGKKLTREDKEIISTPECSQKLGELSKEDLASVKKEISSALRYVKGYAGSSRDWFKYQSSLSEGCARLTKIVSNLPTCKQTAKILIDLLLRLDKKLCTSGVDDSDGTVGGFMEDVVFVLKDYAKLDPKCIDTFEKLCGKETCFEWEEDLVRMFDERDLEE